MDKSTGQDGLIKDEANYEVENQFIIRLPPLPAASLKAVVQSGVLNLKDRLSIQIDQDMRHGTLRFDGWTMPAKIVDLPCVIESHKTLDKKNFYKTADICQLMVCRNEMDDVDPTDNQEKLNKDGKDRRFICPHGITPPLKNVRKKRFRKTLKKKVVDVPEIEKEVKRLFRTDNEATHVRYEVVNADDDKMTLDAGAGLGGRGGGHGAGSGSKSGMLGSPVGAGHNSQSLDLVEHDLFGEMLSSSDDEEDRLMATAGGGGHSGSASGGRRSLGRGNESDENSRMSMGLGKDDDATDGDSRFEMSSSSMAMTGGGRSNMAPGRYVTEFSKGMLLEQSTNVSTSRYGGRQDFSAATSSTTAMLSSGAFDDQSPESCSAADAVASLEQQQQQQQQQDGSFGNNGQLLARLNELQQQLASLQERRQAQELEIASIENLALQQRFQAVINNLREQEAEKRKEYDEIMAKLQWTQPKFAEMFWLNKSFVHCFGSEE